MMVNFYYEYCRKKYSSVSSLTVLSCSRHLDDSNKDKHIL